MNRNDMHAKYKSIAAVFAAVAVAFSMIVLAVFVTDSGEAYADRVAVALGSAQQKPTNNRCTHTCSFTATVDDVPYSVSGSASYVCRNGWPGWGCNVLQTQAISYLSQGVTSAGWALGCGNFHSFSARALTPPSSDGACGWANSLTVAYIPEGNSAYCDSGSINSLVWSGSNRNWKCLGSNGGTDAICSYSFQDDNASAAKVCSSDSDCSDERTCVAGICARYLRCDGSIPCQNGTCPENGKCEPNSSIFESFNLAPTVVEKETDKCVMSWTLDEIQVGGQDVVCRVTDSKGEVFTSTNRRGDDLPVSIGSYNLACSVAGFTEDTSVSCKLTPNSSDF